MNPFENVKPDPELLERAKREADGREVMGGVRPFVRELAERGQVTAKEWVIAMNSYERHLLDVKLVDEVFAKHLAYCASQCKPGGRDNGKRVERLGGGRWQSQSRMTIPTTYDEAVCWHLAPEAARRLEELSKDVTYEVIYVDQINEGRDVWATHVDWIETIEMAREMALGESKSSEYRRTRVVRVIRQVIAEYDDGNAR